MHLSEHTEPAVLHSRRFGSQEPLASFLPAFLRPPPPGPVPTPLSLLHSHSHCHSIPYHSFSLAFWASSLSNPAQISSRRRPRPAACSGMLRRTSPASVDRRAAGQFAGAGGRELGQDLWRRWGGGWNRGGLIHPSHRQPGQTSISSLESSCEPTEEEARV